MLETEKEAKPSDSSVCVLAAVEEELHESLRAIFPDDELCFVSKGLTEVLSAGPSSSFLVIDLDLWPGSIDHLSKLRESESFSSVPMLLIGSEFSSALSELMEKAHSDFLRKPVDKLELEARVRNLLRQHRTDELRSKREEDLYEMTILLRELNKELDRLSHYDALTNLPNRRLFLEVLEREWRRALREASSISILMIDIDKFKSFNDTYGHLEGDDLLQQISVSLQEALRRPGDMVARWGGEEFIVILPRTDKKGAQIVAESLRAAVESLAVPNKIGSKMSVVTVSVGVASTEPKSDQKFMDLIDRADAKLYQAKDKGRNCVVA